MTALSSLPLAALLRKAVTLATEISVRQNTWSIDTIKWTPPQGHFLRSTGQIVLLRTGNQWCGKSTVGIADTIFRCLGRHPTDPKGQKAPIIAWVISPTSVHSVGIQGKAWAMVPKHEVLPDQDYDDVKGFRGRYPALRFKNGSVIHFRTDKQGAMVLSGATIDHVLIDETCRPRVYQELKKRIARRNGTIRLTLTPINAPADYLREAAAQGEIIDLHFKCRPEYAIPEGEEEPLRDPRSGRPMDEQWFAEFRASSPEDERPVVIDGEWQIEHRDRELAGWSDKYIFTQRDPLPMFAEYGFGVDYGQASDRTVVILAAYSPERGVYVLEEWVGDGKVPILEQAAALRRMVRRRGLGLKDVNHRIGDINSAGNHGFIGSMNDALTAAIHQIVKQEGDPPLSGDWRFIAANKRRGSVDYRLRMLNGALSAQRLHVHESCNRLITSMRTYKPGLKSSLVLKDPLDALGYVSETWMRGSTPQPAKVEMRR